MDDFAWLVKPLRHMGNDHSGGFTLRSASNETTYTFIRNYRHNRRLWCVDANLGNFGDEVEAIAAAQADYARRILHDIDLDAIRASGLERPGNRR